MKIITKKSLYDCKSIILDGGIMAYPTESVFGLGCDPFNKQAIDRLKQIKSRNGSGILITESWNSKQLGEYDKTAYWIQNYLQPGFLTLLLKPQKKSLDQATALYQKMIMPC